MTDLAFLTAAADLIAPPPPRWATPGELAQHLNPRTRQTPALDLIDAELVRLADTPDGRLIITMPPQEGKSVRVAGDFPTWLLTRNPDLRIINASYGQDLANRTGLAIRRRITGHPDTLGLRVAPDNGSKSDWTIDGHDGGVLSVGIGAGVTGRPADVMIIDDPIKSRKEADSQTYRDGVWDWWTDEASARLAPGAIVVVILTRWHHDDLAARLIDRDTGAGWRVLNIPAQSDHRPEVGETDPLGRAPGEFMVSARGRTVAQWEARKATAGPATWASLYQGRPTPDGGAVFDAAWLTRHMYDHPLWIVQDGGRHVIPGLYGDDVEMVASWDMAFKDKATSDYVVGQVWLRRGPHVWLLDQVRDRMDFTQSCFAVRALAAKWPQAVAKLVEDKANGPAILNALRATVPGLIPVEPEGSKYARAAAVSPFVEAGNVHLPTPEMCPWVAGLVQECKDFPAGPNDDQVDALSQAVHRLLLVPILDGRTLTSDDYLAADDDDLEYAYAGISPY